MSGRGTLVRGHRGGNEPDVKKRRQRKHTKRIEQKRGAWLESLKHCEDPTRGCTATSHNRCWCTCLGCTAAMKQIEEAMRR